MKKSKKPMFIFSLIASSAVFYVINRLALVITGMQDGSAIEKLLAAIDEVLPSITAEPMKLGTSNETLLAGLAGAAIIWLIFIYHAFGAKKYMHGKEHGSAEWGAPSDSANFIDKNPLNNIILTETEHLSMSGKMRRTKDDDYNRNKNTLTIGGSGSGKTWGYLTPNLMQMHSSYVITDPKGNLLRETGKMLQDNGYTIKTFDLINRGKSDKYNPFEYMRTADDVLKLVNNLISNTNAPNSKTAGDFWEKSEIALLGAIFGYILFEVPKRSRTIATALEMLRMAEVKEDNEDHVSPLDALFATLKEEKPDSFPAKQYDIYKLAAGKTAKSILISVGVRLAPFNIESIADIVSDDDLKLDMIGSEKTALFIILPDTDKSFNFLAAMMFQQMFDILVYKADNEYEGELPYHVRCLMDEFANIGQIPMFEILISTVRSRGISMAIVLQSLAQIKSLYKETWEIITGNCDSLLYLGGMEQSTHEYISKICGKATIDNRNINETRGQTGSYTLNNQVLARDLITPDEVGGIKGTECILKIRNCKPFLSRKYNPQDHINYRQLYSASKDNRFDPEQRGAGEAADFFKNVKEITELKIPEANAPAQN